MSHGVNKLVQNITQFIEDDVRALADDPTIGDTPIERLLMAALIARVSYMASEFSGVLLTTEAARLERLLGTTDAPTVPSAGHIVISRQHQFEGWRVDYLIHAPNFERLGDWRRLIVECDGHDFHERTKAQARRDRSRDRAAQLVDIPIFRFTGSEIWRDPLGCAEQIHDWALKGI